MKNKSLHVITGLTALLATSSLKCQNTNSENSFANYDAYAVERMNEWNIPGMAVVVVKGDSTVFQNVYGYSSIENKTKVTNHSLFAIGSCTKYFTSTGLSILSDEKKIDFTNQVINYYPNLKLKDTVLQKEITITDILSHRTGLEGGDYIYYGANYSKKEVLDKLKYLNIVAPIRNAFIYNNMLYTLAGTIIEKISGRPYESYISGKVLLPLKMNNTTFDLAKTKSEYCLPYSYSNKEYKKMAMPLLTGIEPAGGIWSDITDMTKWIKFHLAKGKVDTTTIVSSESMRRLRTPVHFTGSRMRADETEFKSYGLGMGFSAYKGYRVMYHTGVAGGYTSLIAFLPEKSIGIMVLTNTDTYLFAMMNNLFDRVLGLEQTDWNTPIITAVKEQRKEEGVANNEVLLKFKNPTIIKNSSKFAGVYVNEICKPIEVMNRNNKLLLKHNGIEYPLVQEKENVFMAYDESVYGEILLVFNAPTKETSSGLILKLMGQELEYKK